MRARMSLALLAVMVLARALVGTYCAAAAVVAPAAGAPRTIRVGFSVNF